MEVRRYWISGVLCEITDGKFQWHDVVMASDFDRILAERDDLQQLLNARDVEIDRLREFLNVDLLSNIIRKVDGNHTLGAGALAEKIVYELENKS